MTKTNYAHPQQHGCTAVSAFWCPNHGDCTCPRADDGEPIDGTLDDPSCDLHGTDDHLAKLSDPDDFRPFCPAHTSEREPCCICASYIAAGL